MASLRDLNYMFYRHLHFSRFNVYIIYFLLTDQQDDCDRWVKEEQRTQQGCPKIIGKIKMNEFKKAKKTVEVSIGDSVRILRELQGLSQNELALLTGIPQSTLSAIEHDKVKLGVERAKTLARALKCHPAVIVFPGWDIEHELVA